MAMVKYRHEALKSTLLRCVNQEDDIVLDPATVARCQEAIDYVRQAEATGTLALGEIALERGRLEDENPYRGKKPRLH